MAALSCDDILEKILIGFEVKDLIKFKSVCKSWQSFISSSRFIKSHLNYHYNYNRKNNKIGHKRILMFWRSALSFIRNHLIGSSNGLVCISPPKSNDLLVANPCTREVRKLPKPQVPCAWSTLSWGFGYDSSTDDYKVIVSFTPSIGRGRTCFKVLSLKSNVWKLLNGDVKYKHTSCLGSIGVLCKGALYWFMYDQNSKKLVIISFDLSSEKFKKIPQPDHDPRYGYTPRTKLGNIEECLCIFDESKPLSDKWVMKNDEGKQCWELMTYDLKRDDEFAYFLQILEDYTSYKGSFFKAGSPADWEYINAPIFVESLVSPNTCKITKRKRCNTDDKFEHNEQ